jgi:hypothetical protein
MASFMRVRAGLVLVEALRLIVLTAALGQIAPAATPVKSDGSTTGPSQEAICASPAKAAVQTHARRQDTSSLTAAAEMKTWHSIADLTHVPADDATKQILRCDPRPPQAS